jgi:penicillin-binding protein 1C
LEAARSEWFLQGTQQSIFAIDNVAAGSYVARTSGQNGSEIGSAFTARIVAPTPGTILALDPDIPPQRQRLHLRAEGPAACAGALTVTRWGVAPRPPGRHGPAATAWN